MSEKDREAEHYKIKRSKGIKIHSDFWGVHYRIVRDSIIVYAGDNGVLAMDLSKAGEFAEELAATAEVYKGLNNYA